MHKDLSFYRRGTKVADVHWTMEHFMVRLLSLEDFSPKGDYLPAESVPDIRFDFERAEKLLAALTGHGPVTEECFCICDAKYVRHRIYVHRGRTAIIYAELGRDASPVDLVVMDGDVVGFVYVGVIETTVLIPENLAMLTPVADWKSPRVSAGGRGQRFFDVTMVPMRDGVRLSTGIYLPADAKADEQFPVILMRCPYNAPEFADPEKFFTDRGYAVVLQDVRGRCASEGAWEPFINEMDDGGDTLDWIAAQPWCNGNIGAYGGSYEGYMQFPLAFNNHPNFKCIMTYIPGGSVFRDLLRRGGALRHSLISWMMMGSSQFPDNEAAAKVMEPGILDHRPIVNIPVLVKGERLESLDRAAMHLFLDDYWATQRFDALAEHTHVPTLIFTGLFDGDNEGSRELWELAVKHHWAPRKLVLGPWLHHLNDRRVVAGMDLGPDALYYNIELEYLRWYDHFLKGIDNGVEREPDRYFATGVNQWYDCTEFPPADAVLRRFYLGGGGTLVEQIPPKEACDSYIYDPKNAPKQLSCTAYGPSEVFIPLDYSELEKRCDVLCYTTTPFEEEALLLGSAKLEFIASSSCMDTDWLARVTVVTKDGASIRLSDNIINAQYRFGMDRRVPLTPGRAEQFTIEMPYFAHCFQKGDCLRLEITSAGDGTYAPNPNTGGNIFYETKTLKAHQTVFYGGAQASVLTLYQRMPKITAHSV